MKWGVVRFPGSLDDGDAFHALRDVLGQDSAMLWHKDETLGGAECVLLPGDAAKERPESVAQRRPNQGTALFGAEDTMIIGTHVGHAAIQPSLRD